MKQRSIASGRDLAPEAVRGEDFADDRTWWRTPSTSFRAVPIADDECFGSASQDAAFDPQLWAALYFFA